MGTLLHLESLDLSHNKCVGKGPTEFGTMESLDSLVLNDSDLIGAIEPSLCKWDVAPTIDCENDRMQLLHHGRHGSQLSLFRAILLGRVTETHFYYYYYSQDNVQEYVIY